MAKYRKLGRTSSQRKALIRSQVTALLHNGRIITTEARAKEVRKVAEGLIAAAVKECDNFEEVTVKAKDKPVAPSEPDKPTQPDTDKPNNSGSVETGDKTNMTLWTLLLLVSGIGAIGVYRKKRRTNQ